MKAWMFLLGVAVCVGCGSDDEKDPLASASGFCGEWSKRSCTDRVVSRCGSGSVEECRLAQADACLDLVDAELYSKAGARACLSAVEEAVRDQELDAEERSLFTELGGDCSALLSGQGEAGDKCSADRECNVDRGFSCVIRLGASAGTCQEVAEVSGGRGCDEPNEVCEADFYCDEDDKCIEKQSEGDDCSATVPCGEGLRCIEAADAGVSTCEAMKGLGDECEGDADCLSGICRQGADAKICANTILIDIADPICRDFR